MKPVGLMFLAKRWVHAMVQLQDPKDVKPGHRHGGDMIGALGAYCLLDDVCSAVCEIQ